MDGMNMEKWKAMTPHEKREHIWEYYGRAIIVVLIIIATLSWCLYEGLSKRDPQMSVIMLNMPNSNMGQSGFEGFLQECGYEVYPGAVQMVNHLGIYTESTSPDSIKTNYENVQTLHVLLSAGDKDLIFGTGQWYEETLIHSGALMDLSKLLPESVLEALGDAVMYSEATEEDPSYPCAIDLRDNAWLKQSGYYTQCYVGVATSTDNVKIATEFLTYILGQ